MTGCVHSHEINRLQHCLECSLLVYTRITHSRQCCKLYVIVVNVRLYKFATIIYKCLNGLVPPYLPVTILLPADDIFGSLVDLLLLLELGRLCSAHVTLQQLA